jgi:Ca2+-binding EF-hand superfamily protein
MISIVDKNGDGKISYSEFRVMLGILNRQCQKIWATEEKKKIRYSEFRVMLGKHFLNRQCQKIAWIHGKKEKDQLQRVQSYIK